MVFFNCCICLLKGAVVSFFWLAFKGFIAVLCHSFLVVNVCAFLG